MVYVQWLDKNLIYIFRIYEYLKIQTNRYSENIFRSYCSHIRKWIMMILHIYTIILLQYVQLYIWGSKVKYGLQLWFKFLVPQRFHSSGCLSMLFRLRSSWWKILVWRYIRLLCVWYMIDDWLWLYYGPFWFHFFFNYFQIESGKGLGTNEMTIESLRESGNKAIFIGIG